VTAVDAVRAARDAGRDVVVTDHHLPDTVLPPATALVDPRRADCPSEDKDLCGAGVAFKLAQALVRTLGASENLPLHFLDYVALATVADVVPLRGENRILVRHGLKMLADSRWTGLRALVDAAGLAGRPVRAGHVGFILAPRLNAVGRIGDAKDGLRLLLSDDPTEAAALARDLETQNARRQELDQRILDEALERAEPAVAAGERALVLADDGWHPGVIGIVASRLVERYGRPTFLIAWDGERGRGSGRSIPAFHLHAALQRVGHTLEKFGGHAMAAGLSLRRDQFDAFRVAFLDVAAQLLAPEADIDVVVLQDVAGAGEVAVLDGQGERRRNALGIDPYEQRGDLPATHALFRRVGARVTHYPPRGVEARGLAHGQSPDGGDKRDHDRGNEQERHVDRERGDAPGGRGERLAVEIGMEVEGRRLEGTARRWRGRIRRGEGLCRGRRGQGTSHGSGSGSL
jgi:hypothetical protein